ncbi:hypothetical protein RQP46_001480 [Phenoliferia psychrophenolica]
MYSGLGLLTTSPINTTHVVSIVGVFDKSDPDPSTAFAIQEVGIASFEEAFGDQHTYKSLLGAEKRKVPMDLAKYSFAVTEVWDRTSRRAIVFPRYCENIVNLSKDEREIKHGAYEGGPSDWKATLRLKAKISNVKIKAGMVPEMTEREFSRWKEGNKISKLSCQRLTEPAPESDSDVA